MPPPTTRCRGGFYLLVLTVPLPAVTVVAVATGSAVLGRAGAVSYTHLTLPTKRIV